VFHCPYLQRHIDAFIWRLACAVSPIDTADERTVPLPIRIAIVSRINNTKARYYGVRCRAESHVDHLQSIIGRTGADLPCARVCVGEAELLEPRRTGTQRVAGKACPGVGTARFRWCRGICSIERRTASCKRRATRQAPA